MRRLAVAVVLACALAVPARAADGCIHCQDDPTAAGGEGTITIVHGVSDAVPGRGPTPATAAAGADSEPHDYSYVNELAAPTCTGNGAQGPHALCAASVTSCPALDQVRFWIWHQTVQVLGGPPRTITEGPWVQEAGSFCLGPDDPAAPPVVRALDQAQSQFEEKVHELVPPTVSTVPGPRTLVHWPTRFTALGSDPFAFTVEVAGVAVHLHVAPAIWDWVFGDGSRLRTGVPTTSHTYDTSAVYDVRVDVTWGGYFTVDGSAEQFPIDPPAHSTGAPSQLRVVQALAENRA